jgi:hypothetical protein
VQQAPITPASAQSVSTPGKPTATATPASSATRALSGKSVTLCSGGAFRVLVSFVLIVVGDVIVSLTCTSCISVVTDSHSLHYCEIDRASTETATCTCSYMLQAVSIVLPLY